MTGVVRPVEVQGAFASPAIIALASLFVIAYAMELSGLLDEAIRRLVSLCRRVGRAGLWVIIGARRRGFGVPQQHADRGARAPVVRDVAKRSASRRKRYLIPLVLRGRAWRLLHADRHLDQPAGQRHGLARRAAALRHFRDHAGRTRRRGCRRHLPAAVQRPPGQGDETANRRRDFRADDARVRRSGPDRRPRRLGRILCRTIQSEARAGARCRRSCSSLSSRSPRFDVAPIAATAFAGAVLLILLRVITADEAYHGLRPEVLMLIAGMVVLGIALDQTGLARAATNAADRHHSGHEPAARR